MPLPAMPTQPRWMDDAACGSTTDPDRWFRADSILNLAELAYVRAVCDTCPVTSECLDYALEMQVQGVWAGTTSEQRRPMRRRRFA